MKVAPKTELNMDFYMVSASNESLHPHEHVMFIRLKQAIYGKLVESDSRTNKTSQRKVI